jgi:hypothetical protein
MNLENFTQVYKSVIAESQDDTKFVNYIKSIVEEVIAEKTVKNKSKNGIAEAHDDDDSYGPGPLTMDAIGMVSGYDSLDDYNMPMIPKKYDLEKIENILVRAKKELSSTQYTDFIEGEQDDQTDLTTFTKYRYLLPAKKFLDWVKEN